MREIILRFAGNCRKCGSNLSQGEKAVYERRIGVFCGGCAPTDPEEIRELRQDAADRKADKYEECAEKRREKACATIEHNRTFTDDWAFTTQPGHIPSRNRIIAQNDRAIESLEVARGFEDKAGRLRNVRVAGDAARARKARQEAAKGKVSVGQDVKSSIYGIGKVLKVNRTTARVQFGGFNLKVDLSLITPV